MKQVRLILGSFWFVHVMVALSLFALLGYIALEKKYFIFFVVLSFFGGLCGAFIRVIDSIKK